MKYIIDVFKGALIGIANIIPGFSGGTMAVILKVYERLIEALSDFVKHPVKVLKDIWALLLGVVIGIIFASFVVVLALKYFPFQTIMFFVGLIIGSIPMIISAIKKEAKRDTKAIAIRDVISFIICVTIMIILPILSPARAKENINFGVLLIILLMGVISAGAMIIPGISGSLTLMVLGYYMLIISNIKNVFLSIIKFDFTNFGSSVLVLVFFGIGAILGLIFIARLIKYLIKRYPKTVYIAIFGLLITSIFSITYEAINTYNTIDFTSFWLYFFSTICLIGGALFAYFASKLDKTKDLRIENEKS